MSAQVYVKNPSHPGHPGGIPLPFLPTYGDPMTIRKTLLGISLAFLSLASLAERTLTDQLNRSVTIPDKIERAVILQHQTLNIATQLDAMPQVVGVLAG